MSMLYSGRYKISRYRFQHLVSVYILRYQQSMHISYACMYCTCFISGSGITFQISCSPIHTTCSNLHLRSHPGCAIPLLQCCRSIPEMHAGSVWLCFFASLLTPHTLGTYSVVPMPVLSVETVCMLRFNYLTLRWVLCIIVHDTYEYLIFGTYGITHLRSPKLRIPCRVAIRRAQRNIETKSQKKKAKRNNPARGNRNRKLEIKEKQWRNIK